MDSRLARFIVAVNILAAALIAGIGWKVLGVGRQLDTLVSLTATIMQERGMTQEISSTWVSGGITHKITTPKNVGESDTDWITRHDNAVRAAKVIYPPDP